MRVSGNVLLKGGEGSMIIPEATIVVYAHHFWGPGSSTTDYSDFAFMYVYHLKPNVYYNNKFAYTGRSRLNQLNCSLNSGYQ